MRTLMELLGNPQQDLQFIHIAGTNGKGSTAAMLSSILCAAGYHGGLYTSPALRSFNERFQADGQPAEDEILLHVLKAACCAAKKLPELGYEKPTEFELVTAAGFLYFALKKCRPVVLEVGLGGRLDATNIIPAPEVAVITPIGLDHTEILGSTLGQIAKEKAGILKKGCSAVLAPQDRQARTALQQHCSEFGITPFYAQPAVRISQTLDGQSLIWNKQELSVPLLGAHQLENIGTVLQTVTVLRNRGWNISDQAVCRGLAQVHWPARLQILQKKPPVLLDGAHNGHGAAALSRALTELFGNTGLTLVSGMLADKDYARMLSIMAKHAKRLYLVPPPGDRALSADLAQQTARQYFKDAIGFDSIQAGLDAAMQEQANDGLPVVCFGSLYLAGPILDYFGG